MRVIFCFRPSFHGIIATPLLVIGRVEKRWALRFAFGAEMSVLPIEWCQKALVGSPARREACVDMPWGASCVGIPDLASVDRA
jgi:hypothetical protein